MRKTSKWFARQSPALIVAMIALFVALTGTAVATTSALITGKQIKNSSITGADVKNKSLTARDFRGSVRGARGVAGPAGPAGPQGAQGAQGIQGIQGPPGEPNPNAVDSGKVDGFDANQLVRATTATAGGNDNFDTCAFTTLLTKPVTAPVGGILLVWGNIGVVKDFDDPDAAVLDARVTVDSTVATTTGSVYLEYFGTNEGSVPVSGAVPVAAGTRNVNLQAQECEAGMAFIVNKSITTLFVPFGNGGGQGVLGAPTLGASTAVGAANQP